MKRTTIFMEEHLERELRALARRSGRPMAALVREAVEQYTARARAEHPARLRFIAAGRSGSRDVADRYEELLFQQPTRTPHATDPAVKKRSADRNRRQR